MNMRAQSSRLMAQLNEAGQELQHISGHIAVAEQDLGTVQLLSTAFADLVMHLGDANMTVTMPAKQLGAILVHLVAHIENSVDALANASAQIDVLRNQMREVAQ